jgi:hypothetical protein
MTRFPQLAIVLALASGAALAQKAERPAIRVGDRWEFVEYYEVASTKPNRAWVITSVTPARIEGTENGEPLQLTPEMTVLDSPTRTESNPRALQFPLDVGKQWRYASDWLFKPKGSRGSVKVEVSVVGHEKVTVPAGSFDAFKLVSKAQVGGTSPINSQYDAVITTTYWYAPAARVIVKSMTHNPYLGRSTVELVDYQRRP